VHFYLHRYLAPKQGGVERNDNECSKTASVAIISGLVMVSGASISTGDHARRRIHSRRCCIGQRPGGQLRESNIAGRRPRGGTSRSRSTNCKPGRKFSKHDVVGDPESCIMLGDYTLVLYGIVTARAAR